MKKIFIAIIISISSLSSAILSATEITDMVFKIQEKRVGISLAELDKTENPFILNVIKDEVKKENKVEAVVFIPLEVVYTLKAVLNKAAFIDKKWYKEGDSIGNYTVGHISSTSVVLKNSTDNKILDLKKKKKRFIKLNRGYK